MEAIPGSETDACEDLSGCEGASPGEPVVGDDSVGGAGSVAAGVEQAAMASSSTHRESASTIIAGRRTVIPSSITSRFDARAYTGSGSDDRDSAIV